MEVKVDVHTVHPSSTKEVQLSRTTVIQGIRSSSWCTPESSPKHDVITKTNSNVETKADIRDDFERDKKFQIPCQRVRLGSPEIRGARGRTREFMTELKDIKEVQITSEIEGIETVQDVETPQSPVPNSPLRDKKFKGFRLPTCCNPSITIDPQGRGYIAWLLLVTWCYSYNAWCVPLRATFPYQTPENTPMWMTADFFCDVVYLLDVVFVKPRLMFLNDGFWVDDSAESRKNYRRKLQYKFDLISLLPLEILYFYFGTQKVILRIPRLLKLQTFWEFHQAMDRVMSSPYVVRIGKMLFYVFYLIHLNACAYYAMSSYIGLGSNGWVYDNQGNAYIRCFYFATKTATSIGKNPKPENIEEFLYMTAAWLMGVFVFALLIGQIRDIIATATKAKTEYRKHVDGCIRYLRKLNMPVSLQRRVTSWFSYTWQQRCFDEPKILNSLPYNMKRDVALEVHMKTLSKVQLFRDCSSSLLRDLVLQLRPVSYLPGDVVVRRGDVGHQMYIIKSGECYVMSPDEKEVLATLREGSVFGEISLLGIDGLRRRTATVRYDEITFRFRNAPNRSRGYSSLFALLRSDLDAALQHHKEAAQILRLRADQIIRENAERQARQKLQQNEKHEREESTLRRRRKSAISGDSSGTTDGRRLPSASSQSRRWLTAVDENVPCMSSSRMSPLPKIVFSSD